MTKLLSDGGAEIVEQDIDVERLKFFCKKGDNYFFNKYKEHVIDGNNGRHIYIDNGASVLAIAHLDTVIDPTKTFNFNTMSVTLNDKEFAIIKTPTLDDRLGVFTIMSLLPKLLGSQWADILLTEGEESGKSTAQDFVMPEGKQYNWMVEFDRMGSYLTVKSSHGKTEIRNEDAVLYKYGENFKEATPFKEALTNSGYEKLGTGTFTDICHLQEVGCKGMNVAVGYHNNHSTKAYMYMVEYIRAVNLFTKFYKSYQGTRFPHTEVKRVFTSRTHTYHNPYKKHKFDKTGWMKEATFQPGDIVEYKSYSKRIYIVDDVKRIEDADAKYPRYLVDLVYPDGGVYLANVSDSEITAKESACILCLGTSKPTITIMDTDDTYINLCPYCYQIGIGVLPQCDSCHIELELDDVITLGDGYVSCEDCLFDEEMEISDSRIWIGDIVKMNDGNRLFFVHDLLSGGRSNSLRVTLAAVDTGEIFTNASRGYEADIFTIISKGEIVDDIYNTK